MQLRSRTNATRVASTAAAAATEESINAAAVAVQKRARVKQEPVAGIKRTAASKPRQSNKAIKIEVKQETAVWAAEEDAQQQENAGDAANRTHSKAKRQVKTEIQQVDVAKPKNWEQVLKGIQVMRSKQDADVDVSGCEVSRSVR